MNLTRASKSQIKNVTGLREKELEFILTNFAGEIEGNERDGLNAHNIVDLLRIESNRSKLDLLSVEEVYEASVREGLLLSASSDENRVKARSALGSKLGGYVDSGAYTSFVTLTLIFKSMTRQHKVRLYRKEAIMSFLHSQFAPIPKATPVVEAAPAQNVNSSVLASVRSDTKNITYLLNETRSELIQARTEIAALRKDYGVMVDQLVMIVKNLSASSKSTESTEKKEKYDTQLEPQDQKDIIMLDDAFSSGMLQLVGNQVSVIKTLSSKARKTPEDCKTSEKLLKFVRKLATEFKSKDDDERHVRQHSAKELHKWQLR